MTGWIGISFVGWALGLNGDVGFTNAFLLLNFLFLINASPHDFFLIHRGLSQGDPLSLFLFTIVGGKFLAG